MQRHLGFGITARSNPEAAELARLGARVEQLGYDELWSNDGRLGSGLATVAAAAGGTRRLDLCVGVVPLSGRSPVSIADEVRQLGLGTDRLVAGVGTGSGSSLAVVREAIAELRGLLPGVRLAISALGPRMCLLGGQIADVVLLNWAFPERIAWARERIADGAAAANRPSPRVACYVRVAVGPSARERLATEAARYQGRPRPYSRLFDDQEVALRGAPGVAASDPAEVPGLLAPYREALDSCIVRALPASDALEDWLAVAEAATLPA
jgi:alkanesulfonate monooxygenase SsuD/methylene tetrahydromethanopterin reductase-like flavin-dependent oxidoreductase (luciferase family)